MNISSESQEINPIDEEGNSGNRVGRKGVVIAVAILLLVGTFAAGFYVGSVLLRPLAPGNLTIIDDAGRKVVVPENPQKIISLAPSTTELLFALDMGDLVLAKDNNSDYPEEAKLIPYNVSGYKWIDLEVIIGLEPDIIFAAGINLEWVPDLESRGLKVVILEPESIEDVFSNINLIGSISGDPQKADRLVSELESRLDSITDKTQVSGLQLPRVYIEFDTWGGYWTFGSGSFGDELISLAGGVNIAANSDDMYTSLTSEFIVASDPEIIIYTTNPWISTTPESIKNRPGWDSIDAVVGESIFSIDDNLVSRPGPRLIEGLEVLAGLIHPELFS
jgi:iron complex transport system substrate-binding protein